VSSRDTARHRASLRPATPLSSLSSAVSDGVGTVGRGGVVIAMSSGLVATLGLPAQAVGSAAHPSSPRTAPTAALTLESPAATRAAHAGGVTASSSAIVTFERTTFRPAPKARPRVVARMSPTSRGGRITGSGRRAAPFGSAKGSSVIAVASRYLGVPYVFGGDDPSGWDCSGAVRYIFGQLGISLPRTSSAQYAATTRISRSEAVAGDLVYFFSGSHVYHVGIYAGGGMVYDSGRAGSVFSKRAIWTSSVAYGRVTG
jgi:peptidoglycan DL-endopeptidase CwlO